MEHRVLSLLLAALMLLSPLALPTSATAPGEEMGQVLYTDIVAYIDGYPVRSYNIGGNTYIVVEDLGAYGFDVIWNSAEGKLIISTTRTAAPEAYTSTFKPEANTHEPGTPAMPYLYTQITTWIGDQQVTGYNIGGFTCICMDDLAKHFAETYTWSPEDKALYMTSPKPHTHTWVDATTAAPKTCSECGATEGEPIDPSTIKHTWVAATCTTPKTCSVCGETEGELAEHKWRTADCVTPKTCSVCETTEGKADPAIHTTACGRCEKCHKLINNWFIRNYLDENNKPMDERFIRALDLEGTYNDGKNKGKLNAVLNIDKEAVFFTMSTENGTSFVRNEALEVTRITVTAPNGEALSFYGAMTTNTRFYLMMPDSTGRLCSDDSAVDFFLKYDTVEIEVNKYRKEDPDFSYKFTVERNNLAKVYEELTKGVEKATTFCVKKYSDSENYYLSTEKALRGTFERGDVTGEFQYKFWITSYGQMYFMLVEEIGDNGNPVTWLGDNSSCMITVKIPGTSKVNVMFGSGNEAGDRLYAAAFGNSGIEHSTRIADFIAENESVEIEIYKTKDDEKIFSYKMTIPRDNFAEMYNELQRKG